MRQKRIIGPVLGVNTSIDARLLPDGYSPDAPNVRFENGDIAERFGFASLGSVPAGHQAVYGYDYLQGYSQDDPPVFKHEFVSFQKVSGSVVPYLIDPDSHTRTAMTGTGVSGLHASAWRGFAFRDKGYFYNPNNTPSIFRHSIGSSNDFTVRQPPDAPTVKLSAPKAIGTATGSLSTTQNAEQPFTGVTGTAANVQIAYRTKTDTSWPTGGYTNIGASGSNVTSNGGLRVTHSGITTNITRDGSNPWRGINCDMSLENADGLVFSAGPPIYENAQSDAIEGTTMTLKAAGIYPVNRLIADWDNIRYLVIRVTLYTGDYQCGFRLKVDLSQVTAPSSGNKDYQGYYVFRFDVSFDTAKTADPTQFIISPITLGGVPLGTNGDERSDVVLAYKLLDSTSLLDSEMSPVIRVEDESMRGDPIDGLVKPSGKPPPRWGCWLEVPSPPDTSDADTWKLYAKWADEFVYIGKAATGTAITVNREWQSYSGTEDPSSDGFSFDVATKGKVACAGSYKGWAVWGFQYGFQNIQHSRVGNPERLYSPTDDLDDPERGAVFSLSDNFADSPVSIVDCGDALVICGTGGVYAQIGERPSQMTPPKRLAGSHGVAGPFAACRWHDDAGNPGVAYISRAGDSIYFGSIAAFISGNEAAQTQEISDEIRGLVRSWLRDAASIGGATPKTMEYARIGADVARDSLWVAMGKRVLVLRRVSQIDGRRHWEHYSYTMANWTPSGGSAEADYIAYLAFTNYYELRWMRNSGKIDQVERYPIGAPGSTPPAQGYIGGGSGQTLKDDGSAPPSIYFKSKIFSGPERRVGRVDVIRGSESNTPSVTVDSSRGVSGTGVLDKSRTLEVASGRTGTRFGYQQTGRDHQIKVEMDDGDYPIERIEVEEIPTGGRPLR